jgi:hypothetical protein
MAETARVLDITAALIKIADRFDALADQREQELSRIAAAQLFGGTKETRRLTGESGKVGKQARSDYWKTGGGQ